MTEAAPTTDDASPVVAPGRWRSLPRWARIGLVAAVAVVVTLAALVTVRLVTRAPSVPFGVTATDDLLVGSCLAEPETGLDRYEVVPCTTPHPQQVFATAPLDLDENVFETVDEAMAIFADQVCSRYLEYRLFLDADLERRDHSVASLDAPTADAWRAGDRDALCVIRAADGSDLDRDLYRPMP